MRAVIQRVSEASVTVDSEVIGHIKKGLLILLAIHNNDTKDQLDWMVSKISKLRIFSDDEGKMNKSVMDVGGELLVVSQFTLYGDARKGTRPSYIESAGPEKAEAMYNEFVEKIRAFSSLKTETGEFAAMMDVALVNDGPVTIILDK